MIKNIVKKTQKLFSSFFQPARVDKETEAVSKSPKFLSILRQARAQKGQGLSSEAMRQWVKTELSEN
jgi:hypothetical protein